MVFLTNLPNELLVQIFCYLGDIDDALHFGRTCTVVNRILESPEFYSLIMRSIIVSSDTHRFDIRLCNILNLHNDFVNYFISGGTPISANAPTPGTALYTLNSWETKLQECIMECPDDIDDDKVFDIIARWHGLRVLQDLYISKELTHKDYLYPTQYNAPDLFQSLDLLQNRRSESHDDTPSTPKKSSDQTRVFDAEQTSRFYSAVTCYWLYNEIRWCLTLISYSNWRLPDLLRETFLKHLDGLTSSPLLFSLDLLSIYEFLYAHLLPLHSRGLADLLASPTNPDPLTFRTLSPSEPFPCTQKTLELCNFLFESASFLQPPDLIALAARDVTIHMPPYPLLGPPVAFFTCVQPRLLVRNRILTSSFGYTPPPGLNPPPVQKPIDPHYAFLMRRVKECFLRVQNFDSALPELEEVFEKMWAEEVRGEMFWWAQSSVKAAMRMERWREAERDRRTNKPSVVVLP